MAHASRILWMLEEMGEPFEVETLDLLKPETKSVEFLAASPMGKMPASALARDAEFET